MIAMLLFVLFAVCAVCCGLTGVALCVEWICPRRAKNRPRWVVVGVETRNKRKQEQEQV